MRDNKGQALIEFVIIIPILLWILFALVDFGNILYNKYVLENDLDLVADLYLLDKNDEIESFAINKKIMISYDKNIKYTTINIEKEVPINTLILNNVIGKKYKISSSKTIINGDNNE